jgi:hypothetical protein
LEVHIYNSFFISPLEVHIYNFFSISPLEVHIYNSFSISLCALCTVMKLQEKETFFINMNASCQISKMIISTFSNFVFSINILSPYSSFFLSYINRNGMWEIYFSVLCNSHLGRYLHISQMMVLYQHCPWDGLV